MGWQDAPIIQQGTPSVTPAWQSAPIVPQPSQPAQKQQPAGAQPEEGHSPVQDALDFVSSGVKALGPQLKQLFTQGIDPDAIIDHVAIAARHAIDNPSATISAIGSTLRNATPQQAGPAVLTPMLMGEGAGLLGKGAGLALEGSAEAATPAGQLGLRTATGPGATMAGNTAGPTLDAQNLRVGTSILGADAGVPHSSPVNASTLETARKGPGNLIDTGYGLLPPSDSLSPAAQAQVSAARGPATLTKPTPNVTNQINDIESSLLNPSQPITGPSLRATRNSLNSDAIAGASSDDADTRTIATYKRNVVNALDQHLADSLPVGSPVTPDMVQNARSTLAKNYQLQDLIGKGGDIDLQALASLHRDNPNLLTGPTRTVAQFASDHPEVTGGISDATRISPPSLLNDISHINLLQRPLGSVGQALFGAVGRRLLRGPSGEAIGSAMQTPVAGLGGEFNPLPLNELSPPAGQVGNAPIQRALPLQPGSGQVSFPTGGLTASPPSTPAAPSAAPAGPPGQIPLADLLSHGVEQNPSPDLSLAPMGTPAPQGIPFTQNAEHMAGGLETASPEDWLNKFLEGENNSDVADVRSQGVPDGTMTRAANNASGESAASQEAINRGTKQLAIIDQDGNEQPLLRDVTQADQRAPKGKMIINTSTGEIVDRGSMSQARAEGLRNRWATMGRTLGDHFTMGRTGG